MMRAMKWLCLGLGLLGVATAPSSTWADAQRNLVNSGTVAIISGGIRGTYVRIAADLADAMDDQYDVRVLPVIGKGSVRNIEDLLYLRGIDVDSPMAPEIDLSKQRPAEYMFEQQVDRFMVESDPPREAAE